MTNPQDSPRKRKRILYKATPEGIAKAESALQTFGFDTKLNFAKSLLMSPSTVNKFFQGEEIQLDSIKRICEKLELNWQEVVGKILDRPSTVTTIVGSENTKFGEDENVKTVVRQVTIKDVNNGTMKAILTLTGDINSSPSLNVINAIIREYAGNSIEITDVQSGSIKLFLEGSPEDIARLKSIVESGELAALNGFPIQGIETIDDEVEELEEENQSSRKWDLVRDIRDRAIFGRNLSDTDLSDTDLIRANLRGAILSRADLSDTDLRVANLRVANLSDTDLRVADLRVADLSGADLRVADLRGANLSGADLSGADLRGANLSGANLSGANLSGANLSDAIVENAIFTDTTGLSKLDRVDLERRGAIFGDRPPVPVYK